MLKFFQCDGTDVIIVVHPVTVGIGRGFARFRVCFRPCVRFNVITTLCFHGFGEMYCCSNSMARVILHLVNRPRAAFERGNDGDQHIGVVFDFVKIEMILVIVMVRS